MKTIKELKIQLEKIGCKSIKVQKTGWSYEISYVDVYGGKCEKSHILGVKNWVSIIYNEIKNEL
jgi:hypothetical protein